VGLSSTGEIVWHDATSHARQVIKRAFIKWGLMNFKRELSALSLARIVLQGGPNELLAEHLVKAHGV
jgi:hypothetical protein